MVVVAPEKPIIVGRGRGRVSMMKQQPADLRKNAGTVTARPPKRHWEPGLPGLSQGKLIGWSLGFGYRLPQTCPNTACVRISSP